MMSMGCGMVPMMFPGMQQYMQPMGMGMGMGVDVNQPMMPFPMATPTHMGPGFPVPSYHPISPFVSPDTARLQVNNQGSLLNPARTQNAYQHQQPVQTIPDQYQQYLGSQAMQHMQPPQVIQLSSFATKKVNTFFFFYRSTLNPYCFSCFWIGKFTLKIYPQNDATLLPVTSKPIPSGGPENMEAWHLPGNIILNEFLHITLSLSFRINPLQFSFHETCFILEALVS